MNILSRLEIIAASLDLNRGDLLRGLLSRAKSDEDGRYPSEPTIRSHFLERRKRNGKIVDADGLKMYAKNPKFLVLLDEFVRSKMAAIGGEYNEALSLNSPVRELLRVTKLGPAEILPFLSTNSREIVAAFISETERRALHLPRGLELNSQQLKVESANYVGQFALYRLRGGQNDNKIVLEETVEISFSNSVEVIYKDYKKERFHGTLIVGRDRASSSLTSTSCHLHNLRICHLTLFSKGACSSVVAHLARHTSSGVAHTYRAILKPVGEEFKARGVLDWRDPTVVEVISAINNPVPLTNATDSSFASNYELLAGKSDNGLKLAKVYRAKLNAPLTAEKYKNPANLESLFADLENLLPEGEVH